MSAEKRQTPRTPSNTVYARGPGFVVWLGKDQKTGGYVAWCETGVAELMPRIDQAWRFHSPRAANDGVHRALGPRTRDFFVRVIPISARRADNDEPTSSNKRSER